MRNWKTLLPLTIMAASLCLWLSAFASCAADQVYVSTHPIGAWTGDWTGDGPPLEIVVYNKTPSPYQVTVKCASDAAELPTWVVTVPAYGEKRVLGEVLNKYTWSSPCWVADKEPVR